MAVVALTGGFLASQGKETHEGGPAFFDLRNRLSVLE
jgi:hypothetical protein